MLGLRVWISRLRNVPSSLKISLINKFLIRTATCQKYKVGRVQSNADVQKGSN